MFPGAQAERSAARYALVGAPLDATTSFKPGTRFGPRALRHYATGFEDYDHRTDRRFSSLAVHDHGDVIPRDDVAEYLEYLRGVLAAHADAGAFPVTMGGEHTVTLGAVRTLSPDVLVVLDAHLDLREEYAGRTVSHATVTRRALETVDEAIILGARAGSAAGWERADRPDVTVVPPAAVADWTPTFDGTAYLSVDVDAADPGYAPGTGTPEPGGLAPRTLERVVRAVAPATVGVDVVEVTDGDDGQAAALGAKLVLAAVYAHADA